jgi:flavin-binding protein dodecin
MVHIANSRRGIWHLRQSIVRDRLAKVDGSMSESANKGTEPMTGHVYKTVEIVGSSPTDISDAMRTAVAKAGETLRHLEWVEVSNIRGHVEDGEVAHFQVTMKVGFRLE